MENIILLIIIFICFYIYFVLVILITSLRNYRETLDKKLLLLKSKKIDYDNKAPIIMHTGYCPLNINKCNKCIYSIYVDNPDLPKRCEIRWSDYE